MKILGYKEMAAFEAAVKLHREQMDELQKLNAAAAAETLNTAAAGNPIGALVGGAKMIAALTANIDEAMARYAKAIEAFTGERPRFGETHADLINRIGNLSAEEIVALMRSNGIVLDLRGQS